MYDYVLLNPVPGVVFCTLQKIENLPDALRLKKGVKLDPWPPDVRLHMDPNFPKAIQLPDCVANLAGAIVVSARLKEFIEKQKPASVEYLPMSIVNHKGRIASTDYFIINPWKLQDCIDQKASEITWNPIDPDLIAACPKMVLDEGKIDKDAKVFRLKHYPTKVLFARALADGIKSAKFTGIKFIEIDDMED
jgi:hypothetical protein